MIQTTITQQQIEAKIARLKAENDARMRAREKARRSPRGRYLHPKPRSLVVRLLDEIERRGGMTPGQMAKFIWELSNPDVAYDPKLGRSRWGTDLYGRGLLRFYCQKVGRKWVRNSVPHNEQPWKTLYATKRGAKYQTSWSTVAASPTLIVQVLP
jgi:hypothetical protein